MRSRFSNASITSTTSVKIAEVQMLASSRLSAS